MSKLWGQWRPGCFAMEGDECIRDGVLHRFSDGAWWCRPKDRWLATGVDPFA